MFSLIITLIALALVVILVLATMYFGGSAFGRGAAKASAETLVNQSVQIGAAADLAIAQGKSIAYTPRVTFPVELLKTMPVPPKSAYADGTPVAADWEYYLPGQTSHFGLKTKVKKEVCMEINKSQGFVGIPAAWDGETRLQCFGPATDGGYTYLYEPPSRTPQQHTDAIDKAVADAKPIVPSVRPGYPRQCPDGSTIDTGVCEGAAPTPSKAEGFWVISAYVEPGTRQLYSEGYETTCPAGAIDPTSANASPPPSQPTEAFGSDGAIMLKWDPAASWDFDLLPPLTRTWCIPANPADVPASVVLTPNQSEAFLETPGAFVMPAAARDYVTIADSNMADASVAQIRANGVTWTMIATEFSSQAENRNTRKYPFLVGQKVAIGKASGPLVTHFVNGQTFTVDGVTYNIPNGTITLDKPADSCVPPTPPAPIGTGGKVTQVLHAEGTSAILKEDGSVWMAGVGYNGAFGNCSLEDSPYWQRVATGVARIAKALDSFYLIKTDGSLWASGYHYGSSAGPDHPSEVDPIKFIKLISSGVADAAGDMSTTVFLKTDGTLWMMGLDYEGQFGTGFPDQEFQTPVQIDSNVRSIYLDHGMGMVYVKRDNSLWMTGTFWGTHIPGSSPDHHDWDRTPNDRPMKLADGVSTALRRSGMLLQLKTDGTVWAAGDFPMGCGTYGFGSGAGRKTYLGEFTRLASELGPLNGIGAQVDAIEVRTTSNAVYATGCNLFGTLGDPGGNLTPWFTFRLMANNVAQADGTSSRFLLLNDGSLWAAGYNSNGEFGYGPNPGSVDGYIPIPY